MKSLIITVGLTLVLAGTASANGTISNSAPTNGISSVSTAAQQTLNNCLTKESSSRAIRACTKAIRASTPNDDVRAQLYTRRALHRMAMGRHDDAARDFGRVGQLTQDSGMESLGLGFTAMLNNDLANARRNFKDCNNQGALAPLAEYGLGLTYQIAGESMEARKAYTRALDMRPGWTAVAEQMATLELD
jgi:Tfp pilus assembly protein PilF